MNERDKEFGVFFKELIDQVMITVLAQFQYIVRSFPRNIQVEDIIMSFKNIT